MNTKNTKDVVIKLNASYKVKHEEFENFSGSYFEDVYNQAAQIVQEIIETGWDDLDSETGNGYMEPISNLIAFNGKRGSGKTSAMLSFCDFLRHYERYRRDARSEVCSALLKMTKKVSFTVLECIDATLVSEPRDLIGAVLGKMLVAIKEKEKSELQSGRVKNVEIRKLKNRLGDIYSSMPATDANRSEVAPGEVLEQLSRSWNQQEAFREAVKRFNDYMLEYKDRNMQNYLVIPIDDVDMNLEKGYQLLEAIRKYLMTPNVIVLLAADYVQLGRLCVNEYSRFWKEKDGRSEHLALEYIEKLLPTGRRIYMPELYQDEILYGKKIVIEDEKGNRLSIKETIFNQVWEHTGLLLNMNAEMRHWLLPHSLRKLSNYMNLMHSLQDFDDKMDASTVFTKNIGWFYDDLMSRYLNEKDVENIDYSRVTAIIDGFYNDILENKISKLVLALKKGTLDDFLPSGNKQNDISNYGVMMQELYKMKDIKGRQVMVQAVSFAVSLYVRTYIHAMESEMEKNLKGSNEYRDILLKVTKGFVWGDFEIAAGKEAGKSAEMVFRVRKDADQLILKGDLSGYELLVLAMQLRIKQVDDQIEGTLRFGNFVDVIFNFENEILAINSLLQKQKYFEADKDMIQQAYDAMIGEYVEWRKRYKTTCVLPFDSIEFMFNLYEKLYGELGVFQGISVINNDTPYDDMFEKALRVIDEILEEYDKYYEAVRGKYDNLTNINLPVGFGRKYSEVYRECPFVKYMMSEEHKAERKKILQHYLDFFCVKDEKTKDSDKKQNLPNQNEEEKKEENTSE